MRIDAGVFRKPINWFLTTIILLTLCYYFLTYPRPFSSIVNINYEVKSITVLNGIHQAPAAVITDKTDINSIIQRLTEGKYKREYGCLSIPPGVGGPIFRLVLNGNHPGKKTAIDCYSRRVRIHGKNYITDQNITWQVSTNLMMKNFDQQAELGLVQTAHQNINLISKKYGDQSPYIAYIVPGITNKFGGPRVKYDVHLQGSFKKGSLKAQNLYFSMQEIYPVFWDIRALGSNNKTVWKE